MDSQDLDQVRNNATQEMWYFSYSIIWNISKIPWYRLENGMNNASSYLLLGVTAEMLRNCQTRKLQLFM